MVVTRKDRQDQALRFERLLESVYRRSGFDFREFDATLLQRRIAQACRSEAVADADALEEKASGDPSCMERLLVGLTIRPASIFGDPGFYRAFRRKVVPLLRTYPFSRIWHVGCSTGEEVYSMAILLEEEGLYDRCRLYATEMSEAVIALARRRTVAAAAFARAAEHYARAGGRRRLEEYVDRAGDAMLLRASLSRSIVFAQHNFVTDRSFNEFHVILCRHVLSDLRPRLQERVHELLYGSLATFGLLAMGRRDPPIPSPWESYYETFDSRHRLHRRIR